MTQPAPDPTVPPSSVIKADVDAALTALADFTAKRSAADAAQAEALAAHLNLVQVQQASQSKIDQAIAEAKTSATASVQTDLDAATATASSSAATATQTQSDAAQAHATLVSAIQKIETDAPLLDPTPAPAASPST